MVFTSITTRAHEALVLSDVKKKFWKILSAVNFETVYCDVYENMHFWNRNELEIPFWYHILLTMLTFEKMKKKIFSKNSQKSIWKR